MFKYYWAIVIYIFDTILNYIIFIFLGDLMDNYKIIICVLVVIVIVLLVAVVAIIPHENKQNTNLIFVNGQEFNEGDSIQIKLADANGTVLGNQTVNVTITDGNKASYYYSVVTNDNGIGTLKLDKGAGEYNVTISYSGNNGYNSCNATQKITIKEKATQTEQTTTGNSLENYRTRSDTDVVLTQSGDIVELNRAGDIVSVNGDPNGGGH